MWRNKLSSLRLNLPHKICNLNLALVLVYWEFLIATLSNILRKNLKNIEPTPANLFQIYHVVYVLAVILCGCCVLALGVYVTRFCQWQHFLCGSQPVSVPGSWVFFKIPALDYSQGRNIWDINSSCRNLWAFSCQILSVCLA